MTSLVERLREYAGWRLRAHQSECTDPLWPKPTDIALAEGAVKEIGRLRNDIVRLQRELSEARRKAFEEALSLVVDVSAPSGEFGRGYKQACDNIAAAIRKAGEEGR
ncbi:hypothetical protein CDO26_05575 [Sinorhizobium meliloti]|uniref:hypothetical protein n=1 Tax=Rhizobium meliloti TaxID=382 RepID=UPI000B4A330D|nr:hypothetical protein [Sinorhizobium meliloti]ASP84123.1 hypothetical protein CDO26_05575 [Sinorhizobium meliloti]MQW26921.1 hypothetical protein [Sinorhizobium meliloti]